MMSQCVIATQTKRARGTQMNCYECSQEKNDRVAIGLCHHCSAGICAKHAIEVSRNVTAGQIINFTWTLPVKARQMLCNVCKAALEQPRKRAA